MEKPRVTICVGSSCFARGNEKNVQIAEDFLNERGLADGVDLELEGCLCTGACLAGPVVIVNGQKYTKVDAGLMRDLLEEMLGREESR